MNGWEPVIGLEIHAQLNTKSKLFSSAPNHFGDEPNVNITTVCTGQPGALPQLNKEAVRKAVQFGLAIRGTIHLQSHFDRKSYFYPDSPRNFQITQYEMPIITGGVVLADVGGKEREFALQRVHLEDDAGMLKHFSSFAGVDYNRAGAPLIEIVSEPCIHSPQEASAYAMAIRLILLYLDVSDCNMEEGSLRFDANVSVRRVGERGLRPRVEIKNMNSFTFLELATAAEIRRQIALYTSHPDRPYDELIPSGTYRWDPDRKETVLMRRKERADDYRYFPEPDLLPLALTQEWVDQIRDLLPELPADRLRRYTSDLGLSAYAASVLIHDKAMCDYFEEALKLCPKASPSLLCNWITVEFAGRLKEKGHTLISLGLPPVHLAKLVQMIEEKVITGRIAKSVADDMVATPNKDPEQIVQNNPDYQPVDAIAELEPLIDQVLTQHAQSVMDYKKGHKKAFAFLVGQVMKLTGGKAAPDVVNELLRKKL
jgi:aspartyl-tRNA(Asn)/glutamyl-tRNA(Gln) amidotransferase subunit B